MDKQTSATHKKVIQ